MATIPPLPALTCPTKNGSSGAVTTSCMSFKGHVRQTSGAFVGWSKPTATQKESTEIKPTTAQLRVARSTSLFAWEGSGPNKRTSKASLRTTSALRYHCLVTPSRLGRLGIPATQQGSTETEPTTTRWPVARSSCSNQMTLRERLGGGHHSSEGSCGEPSSSPSVGIPILADPPCATIPY